MYKGLTKEHNSNYSPVVLNDLLLSSHRKSTMPNHLPLSKVSILVLSLFIAEHHPCSAKFLPDSSKLKSGDLWLPRELGRFHLKDAGFVEVYERTPSEVSKDGENEETYPEKYNLFITTFNAGNLINSTIFHMSFDMYCDYEL